MYCNNFRPVRWTLLKRLLAALILLVTLAGTSFAQQKRSSAPDSTNHLSLRVLLRAYGDSVVIRWAPASAVLWEKYNASGYVIHRTDYTNPAHPVTTLLTPTAFKPMTLKQMKAHLDKNNKYAAIAAQAMYGNDFRMTRKAPTSFAGKIKQGHNALSFRYTFAMQAADFSAPVANALALRWVDKDVKKGGRYLYTVTSPAGKDTVGSWVLNKETPRPVPQGLKAFGFDKSVELHWNRRQMGNFDAYDIERSDDRGKTYHVVNKLPFYSSYSPPPPSQKKDTLVHNVASLLRDHQVYTDSIPKDYKTYYYRICGYTPFGDRSPYSKPVKVHGIDLTPPIPPVIDTVKSVKNRAHTLQITWSQKKKSPDLAGYYVDRSNSLKGTFLPLTKNLLDKNTRIFNDTTAVPHAPNFYVIVAVDSAKNVSSSSPQVAFLTDSIPPAPPTGLTGKIDSNGVVHLHWNKNTEPDLRGYQVYYSFNPHFHYFRVTHTAITANSFADTIAMHTLNRRIYYKVAALDKNYNQSAFSKVATLKKPIVVPPSAPSIGQVYADSAGAHIQLIESRSEGAMGYEIYREKKGGPWKPVARLNQDWQVIKLPFTDSTITANTDYYYAAETIDSTGIHSKRSFTVHVRHHTVPTLPALNSLNVLFDKKHNTVKLSWKYKKKGNYFFIIYRGRPNRPLVPWHSYGEGTRSGEDNPVNKGIYRYAIQIVNRDQHIKSVLSKPVRVAVP